MNILPLLREELNPRACEHLAETAERLALAEDYLAGQAREAAKRLAGRKTDGGAGLFLDREGFLAGAGGSESVYSAVLPEGGF